MAMPDYVKEAIASGWTEVVLLDQLFDQKEWAGFPPPPLEICIYKGKRIKSVIISGWERPENRPMTAMEELEYRRKLDKEIHARPAACKCPCTCGERML